MFLSSVLSSGVVAQNTESSPPKATAQERFTSAVGLFERRLYRQSAEAFGDVVALRPDSLAAQYGWAMALFRSERPQEAWQRFEVVAAMDGATAEMWMQRGLVARRLARVGDAETSFSKALELAPKNAEILHYAGLTARESGRGDEARTLFERALEIDPSRTDSALELAEMAFRRGELPKALSLAQRVSRLDAESSRAAYLLMRLAARRQDSDEARRYRRRFETLRRAEAERERIATIVNSRLSLAFDAVTKAAFDQAIDYLAAVLEIAPGQAEALGLLARIAAQCDDAPASRALKARLDAVIAADAERRRAASGKDGDEPKPDDGAHDARGVSGAERESRAN